MGQVKRKSETAENIDGVEDKRGTWKDTQKQVKAL